MSTQEEAREAMAQSRQQEEQVEQSMLSRAQAEVETSTDDSVEEEAREAMVAKRQHEENVQRSMLSRAAEETGLPRESTRASSE